MKNLHQESMEAPQVSKFGARNMERLDRLTNGRNGSATPISSVGGYSASSSSKHRPGSTSAYGGSYTRGTLTTLSSNKGFKNNVFRL